MNISNRFVALAKNHRRYVNFYRPTVEKLRIRLSRPYATKVAEDGASTVQKKCRASRVMAQGGRLRREEGSRQQGLGLVRGTPRHGFYGELAGSPRPLLSCRCMQLLA